MLDLTRTFLLLLLLTGLAWAQLPPQAQPDSPFQISDIKANSTSPFVVDVSLTTTTLREIPAIATVPVPTAPMLMSGNIPLKQLLEMDLLDSGYVVDFNGDGMLDQVLIRQYENGLRFDGVPVQTMGDGSGLQQPYQSNGEMRSYLMSPDAPWFAVQYYQPPALSLLLAHRDRNPQVIELPNPNLQLMIFEHSDPMENPRFTPDPPTFKLLMDGKPVPEDEQHLVFAWEPDVFQNMNLSPRWLRGYWLSIPLSAKPGTQKHDLQVQIGGEQSAVAMYAQINYAPQAGQQMRTNRSIGVIWAPTPSKPAGHD